MSDEPVRPDHLLLENVRLSFPDLWRAKSVKKDDEPRFSASFLLDKKDNEAQIKMIKVLMWQLAVENFGGTEKAKALIEKGKLHVCLHEGNEKEWDGYNEDNQYVSTSSKTRPHVVDRDHSPLLQEDGRPYAGCYVNAAIRLWVQNNEFGKRINAELLGVQFVKNGIPFGAPPFKPEEVFPKLEEEKEPEEKKKGKGKGKAKDEPGGDGGDDDEIPF